MAVFPDRIVQKNSTDPAGSVRTAVDPVIGSDPIIGGELVVQRSIGSAQLLTLDANNTPVVVGVSANVGATTPSIKLNFEEDGTDTPYEYVVGGYPFDPSGKFGNCYKHIAGSTSPRINPLRIQAENVPVLGSETWTFNFWFKSDFTFDFYSHFDPAPNSLLVVSARDYVHGPGAFTVTIDGGTTDTGGIGTDTSRTADLAKGAIVFGLGGMYGATESTIPQIPSTGEIVTSAATGVCDNNWHYITFMHEGSGVYSCFIDGELKERNILDSPVNYGDSGTSGILMPSGLEFGGALQINDNDVFPGSEFFGFNGRLDGVTLYAGNAIFRGLRQFTVPTSAPNDDPVQQPLDTLRTLLDTGIDAIPGNGETLVYNATEGAWENSPAPAFSLTGNNLGDIGDVTIAAVASLTQGETITWDVATSNWINSPILIENTDVDTTLTGTGYVIRHDGLTGWKSERLDYADLSNAPAALSDLTQDLDLSLYNVVDLADVVVTSIQQGDVLAWNDANSQFENIAQPPANISGSNLDELLNVKTFADVSQSVLNTYTWLAWNAIDAKWEPRTLEYTEVFDAPADLSDFNNDLTLNSFTNDAGYLSAANLSTFSLNSFGDVTITSPVESHVLVYRSGQWRNEVGPPANITSNSIGDLADVTKTQAANTLPAVVTMEDMGHLVFDSPLLASNITYQVMYDHDRLGLGLSAIRDSDDTGSEIFVSRGGGVDLRSDVNFFRLRGKPDVTTNRPELRFETGDSFATPATGHYISLKMPSTVLEDQTYYLPQEDGDVGDVLATNGTGELSWIARASNNDLGQLSDVDLSTQLPVDGSALIYNSAASMWVPGASVTDLSTSVLNDISDVSYGGTPGTGQALLWNGSAWVPNDIAVSLDDLADVTFSNGAFTATGLQAIVLEDTAGTGFIGFTSPANYNATVLYTLPVDDGATGEVLTTNGSGVLSWIEPGVDEASPAIVWDVTNVGVIAYGFTGSGFSTTTSNPALYVVRGQKYTFNKTISGHPFELVEADGVTQYTAGAVESQPLALGELNWTVPMDAPSTLGYRCTAHPLMKGIIYVLNAGVDLASSNIEELANVSSTAPTAGQALVWNGTEWVPGSVLSSGSATGSAISQSVTETQVSDANGFLTFIDLGTSGTLIDIQAGAEAWVTIYSSVATRAADAARSLEEDPAQGSGVLAEFVIPASTTVLTTPSTNYFNSEGLISESIYAVVRNPSTAAALNNVSVTVRAFAISGYTAVSGGTFGSG
ncbi:MAG: hypothetical protein CMH53_04375 [Myxococcales bacterium]|nr:hypothetical protein [Myxococcales bacterium]